MRVKKLTAMILTVMIMTMSVVPVFAGEEQGDGNGNIPVSYTAESSYTVQLPAAIALSLNGTSTAYEGSGDIKIKGSIGSAQYIELGFGNDADSDGKDDYEMTGPGGVIINATSEYEDSLYIWGLEASEEAIKTKTSVSSIAKIGLDYSTEKTVIKCNSPIPAVSGSYSGNTNVTFMLKNIS